MKRHSVIIVGTAIVVLFIFLNIVFVHPETNNTKGIKLEQRETMEICTGSTTTTSVTADNPIVAKGKHIVVRKNDLDYYVTCARVENINSGTDIEDSQLRYLIKRETLFYNAKLKGFLVGENELNSYVKEQKKMVSNADNYSEFCKYLKEIGISEDAYWEKQPNQIRKDLTISNYLNSLKKKIADKNNLVFYPTYVKVASSVENDSTSDYVKLNTLWNKYYEKMVKSLVNNEDVEIY